MTDGFEDKFSFFNARGLPYEQLGASDKLKSFVVIALGVELCFFGISLKTLNVGVVLVIYLYQNILEIFDWLVQALASTNSSAAKRTAAFIASTTTSRFVCVVIFILLLSSLIVFIATNFLRIGIFLGFFYLVAFGPVKGILVQMGVGSDFISIPLGVVAGLIGLRLLHNAIFCLLIAVLFSAVGTALIFFGLDRLKNLNLSLCYRVLRTHRLNPAVENNPNENILYVVTLIACTILQWYTAADKRRQ
ncbi:hypothetical protein NEFER03_1330 [Nematocida sp. LUAm3]|nr:hypothetical protein NEFER03_1330 [Nematocida sp. LUAm3]KAI5174048.1 hypothetical protein NEFER02_0515 [Nematocida sp. LUAm2]KAI5177209.1 hypothetical protein NEFER01_0484 [Nematocida sp. LUAm1]